MNSKGADVSQSIGWVNLPYNHEEPTNFGTKAADVPNKFLSQQTLSEYTHYFGAFANVCIM